MQVATVTPAALKLGTVDDSNKSLMNAHSMNECFIFPMIVSVPGQAGPR